MMPLKGNSYKSKGMGFGVQFGILLMDNCPMWHWLVIWPLLLFSTLPNGPGNGDDPASGAIEVK